MPPASPFLALGNEDSLWLVVIMMNICSHGKSDPVELVVTTQQEPLNLVSLYSWRKKNCWYFCFTRIYSYMNISSWLLLIISTNQDYAMMMMVLMMMMIFMMIFADGRNQDGRNRGSWRRSRGTGLFAGNHFFAMMAMMVRVMVVVIMLLMVLLVMVMVVVVMKAVVMRRKWYQWSIHYDI